MNTRTKVLLSAGLVIVVVLGAGVWWWVSRDAPDAVSLDAATEQVSTTAAGGDNGDGTTSSTPDSDALSGTWNIDNKSGEFDFESATGSFAGYRITEELVQIGTNEAVGRTGDVTGAITISGTTLDKADLEVQMTTLTSDESMRDGRVQEALDTASFPTSTFTLTEPVPFGASAAEGDPVNVKAVGELTIHGVTRPVTATIEAKLVDDTAVVIGSIPVKFSDFDVEAPGSPRVLSVADEGTVEFQLLFKRT